MTVDVSKSAATSTATLTRTQLRGVAAALIVGGLPVLLTATTISVAFGDVARDLDVPVGAAHWVATGYLLAITAVVPLLGWLTGRLGSRRVWLVALGVFGLGSALSAFAWSLESLVVFRVVQGLGGGLVLPLLQAVIAQLAGPAGFTRAMAVVAIPGQLVPIVGPILGGVLLEGPGWRWVFVVNVPLVAAALLLARRCLPAEEVGADTLPLDLVAMAAGVPGLVAALHGLSLVTAGDDPMAGVIWTGVGVALVGASVLRGRRGRGLGLVDAELLRRREFRRASLVVFLLGVCVWGTMLLVPLYLQNVRDLSGTVAGLVFAAEGLGTVAGLATVGSLVDRVGERVVVSAGLFVGAAATAPLALGAVLDDTGLVGVLVLRGLGFGSAGVPALAAAYEGLPQPAMPRAAAAVSISQRMGAALGTALVTLILQQALERQPPAAAYDHTFGWAVALSALTAVAALRLPWRLASATPLRSDEPCSTSGRCAV